MEKHASNRNVIPYCPLEQTLKILRLGRFFDSANFQTLAVGRIANWPTTAVSITVQLPSPSP